MLTLRTLRVLIVFTLPLLLSFETLAGGKWGSTGGGSGVACFSKEDYATQADSYINNGKSIPQNLRKEIKELSTLDYWEWEQTKPHQLFTPKATDYKGIMKEVDERVSQHAPIYIFRLRQAAHLVDMQDWSNKTDIPRVNDAKAIKEIPKNCRLVQLVVRHHRDEAIQPGYGPTGKIPEVKIEFDQDLFALLNPLNQAILLFHEQMYLLGHTIGHNNSDDIRFMVMRLFEKDLSRTAKMEGKNFNLRIALNAVFGDYILYFSDVKIEAKPFTQESRFNSFMEMIQRMRQDIIDCEKTGIDLRRCKDIAMNPEQIQKWFTDEMAFIFDTNYVLDDAIGFMNAEIILAPIKEKGFVDYANKTMREVCKALPKLKKKMPFPENTSRAIKYCSDLALQIPGK